MRPRARELWLALLTILIITLIYIGVTFQIGEIPAASQFFGHSLGILGILLMLITETGYSLRKRSRSVRWGRMDAWLQFHIFTGLVGPCLALLHTSWKFNGLAGMLTLFTIIIVISGFIGRYIFTAIPRTIDGIDLDTNDVELRIILQDRAFSLGSACRLLATWHTIHIPIGMTLFTVALIHIVAALYLATLLH